MSVVHLCSLYTMTYELETVIRETYERIVNAISDGKLKVAEHIESHLDTEDDEETISTILRALRPSVGPVLAALPTKLKDLEYGCVTHNRVLQTDICIASSHFIRA